MKIICAGLGKTGTTSLARALRHLGFTFYDWPEHQAIHGDEWLNIYRGRTPDFVSMYEGVDAVTDLPAACWFQEILEAFPDAKVVLTMRDNEDVWLKSWVKQTDLDVNLTGTGFFAKMFIRGHLHRKYYTLLDYMNAGAFGSLEAESTVLFRKKYREHNERVQAVVPENKLLVFNLKQGWKPLCDFLECEIPEQEFPFLNNGMSACFERLEQKQREFWFYVTVILTFLFVLLSFFYCFV